ncbi:MAG: DUF4062 domain-containing protein, partial [Proteobacteria bacterium]|nr:DUF4062 domain-containing protein [Pseudomonadota bacterium]
MPKHEMVLYVLVSSPNDVRPEREEVLNVIAEWNQTWSRELGVRLDPLRYETHTHPNFDTDPQTVINKQIGDDYDIFIGILWARFGTSTPRADSGTIEEFQRAYSRHKKDPDSISVKFYFKDEQIRPSEIEVEQLNKVQEFKKEVSALGGLYHTFTNIDEFAKLLRMHISF